MIAIDNLTIRAGSFVLQGMSLTVAAGDYAVLMGKTGSGKTTLLEAICGLKPVETGTIRLVDRDVTGLKPAERGIGYVPQDRALFPTMTVWQHIAFALAIRKWDRQAIDRRVDELSKLLGIHHLLDRLPHGLSGGEAQRVALGRALSSQPRVLLLDEPLSALDEDTRGEMTVLLKSISRQSRVTTLHVTHSIIEANKLADKLLLLSEHGVAEVTLPLSEPEAPIKV